MIDIRQEYKKTFREPQNLLIMLKDKPVLEVHFNKGYYKILEKDLLPTRIKNCIIDTTNITNIQNTEDIIPIINNNSDTVTRYLASRVLSLSRSNAKQLFNANGFIQSDDDHNKAKIAISTRAVAMNNSYWVKLKNDEVKWEDIDPKHNSLSEIVTQIALKGSSLSIQGKISTPEYSNDGIYAKSWIREGDGNYLYKKGTKGGIESDIEISVSNILDCFNIPHIKYEAAKYGNDSDNLCKSKCIATDELDMVKAEDVFVNYNQRGMNFEQEILKIDEENIYKMCIADYLISNSDRHLGNWGFFQNNDNGHILCCHLMFDHNNAFNEEHMEAVDGGKSLIFQGKSKRDVALYAIKKVKIECLKPVTRDLFINNDMYESFMQRACELGLYKEVKPTFMQKIGVKPFEKYIPISLSTQEYDMWENINRKYQKDIIDSKKEEELNIAKDILEREKETKDNPITHTQAKNQFLQDVKQGEVNINATSSSIILDMKNGTDEECL